TYKTTVYKFIYLFRLNSVPLENSRISENQCFVNTDLFSDSPFCDKNLLPFDSLLIQRAKYADISKQLFLALKFYAVPYRFLCLLIFLRHKSYQDSTFLVGLSIGL